MDEIILGFILSRGVVTINEISEGTGFEKEKVRTVLSTLLKKGLLSYGKNKNFGCNMCPLSKICKTKGGPHV